MNNLILVLTVVSGVLCLIFLISWLAAERHNERYSEIPGFYPIQVDWRFMLIFFGIFISGLITL